MCAPVGGGISSQTDACDPSDGSGGRADDLDDDGPDAASAATIIAGVAAAMCAVLIGVVGFLYWKMQQVQGQAVRPVGQAIAVEMATYGQTMAAPSYVLKAKAAGPRPPGVGAARPKLLRRLRCGNPGPVLRRVRAESARGGSARGGTATLCGADAEPFPAAANGQ